MSRSPDHRSELQDATAQPAHEAEAEHDSGPARRVSLAGLRQIQQKANGTTGGGWGVTDRLEFAAMTPRTPWAVARPESGSRHSVVRAAAARRVC